MDCILLKKGYNIQKLINDCKIAESNHNFINPETVKDNSFSLSKETFGWEAIPLHTVNGKTGNIATIPVNVTGKTFQPNDILLKCHYFQEILKELNTDVYLVRLMKLKANGYIAPHTDKLLNKDIVRCHIPIITNSDVHFYIGNKEKKDYYLKAGNLYFINACYSEHYVKNDSKIDRIHLVIDLKLNDFIKKYFTSQNIDN